MKRLSMILVVIFCMLTFCSCIKTNKNINNYAIDVKKYQASSFMPGLEELGEYVDLDYFLREDNGFFSEYSMQLVVKYEKETFLKEKERIATAYTYIDAPQKPYWDNSVYTLPANEFSVDGFDFKVAVLEDTVYPKNFGMVGISEEKFEIAYLWAYCYDLDYICTEEEDPNKAMIEFVDTYFSL